jgi:hypothetical protein
MPTRATYVTLPNIVLEQASTLPLYRQLYPGGSPAPGQGAGLPETFLTQGYGDYCRDWL